MKSVKMQSYGERNNSDMSSQQNSDINIYQSVNDSIPYSTDNKNEVIHPIDIAGSITSGLRVGSLLRKWAEVSKINYMSSQPLDIISSGQSLLRRRSIGLPSKEYSIQCFVPSALRNKSEEDLFAEQFPINVTNLMNEDQLWGCFYTFPELYADVYSPVVQIRNAEDVPEIIGKELTRDIITPHLTYLKRTPILGDYVYIKLDLSSKHLINIEELQYYKYLVYLDLSSNLLTELSVLSYLPYLQFLSVAFNRLSTVLEYDSPQWFLTEVHYKYNSVKIIRDLNCFWSITVLDLSHNNIKYISGLENLRFLRRLDLSFNHIQRLENLNHLHILWLDVSYNNITNFEFGPQTGLWTLLHLEYLNLNENKLDSMKLFSGCTRLRELHTRNNRFGILLELAVYMRQMRRLIVLDLRANAICSSPHYKDVVINTFPVLLNLDSEELDPVVQVFSNTSDEFITTFMMRTLKMEMTPDVHIFATRRLQRLLFIQQLSRARVSSYTPPADTTEVPIVVLVGYEGVGSLARRLAKECNANIALARQHTTAPYHYPDHYQEITRSKFDDMLLAGEFLTYGEMDGESYGLSREEAFVKDGKVKIVSMDLLGALMLKLRGRRPYLILTSYMDKKALSQRQSYRKSIRNIVNLQRITLETPLGRSTLQVLLSDRIIITGILNEILMCLPEEKEQSEFVIESKYSLMMDSDDRQAVRAHTLSLNFLTHLTSSTTSVEEIRKRIHDKTNQMEQSLYSLHKEQGTDEYISYVNGQNSCQSNNREQIKISNDTRQSKIKPDKVSNVSHPKSVDFIRCTSSTWKVTEEKTKAIRSISTRMPWPNREKSRTESGGSIDKQDLWFAFLTETGLLQASDTTNQSNTDTRQRYNTREDDTDSIIEQIDYYHQVPYEKTTSTIRDDYEDICRKCPGLFWDTVTMDDPKIAFKKVKKIIREIVESQKNFKPMYDVDFTNLTYYPTVEKRLSDIREQISRQRFFN